MYFTFFWLIRMGPYSAGLVPHIAYHSLHLRATHLQESTTLLSFQIISLAQVRMAVPLKGASSVRHPLLRWSHLPARARAHCSRACRSLWSIPSQTRLTQHQPYQLLVTHRSLSTPNLWLLLLPSQVSHVAVLLAPQLRRHHQWLPHPHQLLQLLRLPPPLYAIN